MKYVAPALLANSFTCPHCGTLAQQSRRKFSYDTDYRKTPGSPTIWVSRIDVSRCTIGENKAIWLDKSYIYPSHNSAPTPNADMPAEVLTLYDEAASICSLSSRAACALLRLAIDRLCHTLGKQIGALTRT